MTGLVIALTAVQLAVAAGLYVWTSLALSAVFQKAAVARWKAWVPVLNWWELFQLGGMRGWWAAVLAGGGAMLAVVVAVLGSALSTAAMEASFGGDATAAGEAMLIAVVLPTVLWLIWLIPAVILQARMLTAVGRRFGFGLGYTVLGVLLFPVWASVAGWGPARWDAGPAGGVGVAPVFGGSGAFGAPGAAGAAAPVAVPPLPSFPGAPALPAVFGQVTTPPAAPGVAPAVPPVPAVSPAPAAPGPAAASHAAASLAPASALTPTPITPSPADPWAPPAAPYRSQSAPEAAPTPEPAWSLRLPGGLLIALTSDIVVLGRNPLAPAGIERAQLIEIDDVTRTVSKTHALLQRTPSARSAPAAWTITDLGSTNGVFLAENTESGLTGPTPVSGAFFLGDAELVLQAGGTP